MTAALLDRPSVESIDQGPHTLQDLLDSTLQAARANGSAECPVCHARMTSTRAGASAGAGPGGAECGGCGSRLS
jgi:hypothetical protein